MRAIHACLCLGLLFGAMAHGDEPPEEGQFPEQCKPFVTTKHTRLTATWGTFDSQPDDRSAVTFVGFSADGMHALSADAHGKLVLWDAATDTPKATFNVSGDGPFRTGIGISASGERVLVRSGDHAPEVWGTTIRKRLTALGKEAGASPRNNPVALDAKGLTAATVRGRVTIQLWDVGETRVVSTLSTKFQSIVALAFSPDGKRLVSGGLGGMLAVWDVRTGEAIRQWTLPEDQSLRELAEDTGRPARYGVETLSFTADGTRLLTGDSGKHAILWDLDTGQSLACFDTGESVAIAPDGAFAVAVSANEEVNLIDLVKREVVDKFELPQGSDWAEDCAVAFAPDGRTFVVGTQAGVALRFEVVKSE